MACFLETLVDSVTSNSKPIGLIFCKLKKKFISMIKIVDSDPMILSQVDIVVSYRVKKR
jgi:hypothetical protein